MSEGEEAAMVNVAKVRAGLGRGLGALIPSGGRGVLEVDLARIKPNPRQPRQRIDAAGLGELAESIRLHGLLQPLVVARGDGDGDYVLIAGERRLEAARLAGIERVPVVVREANPEEMLELALVENIQRADLGPREEAAAYHQLVSEFGLTQERVAARVGKSRAAVANSLRLLGLSDRVKAALWAGEITEGHGRALGPAPGMRVPGLGRVPHPSGAIARRTRLGAVSAGGAGAIPWRWPAVKPAARRPSALARLLLP